MDLAKLNVTSKIEFVSKPGRRPGLEPKDKAPAGKLPKEDKDTPGLINGQQAMSKYEWNTARALWALHWDFAYQVPVSGGYTVRGGQVLDFLVYTKPTSTAVIVNGDYWHQGDEEFRAEEVIAALIRQGEYVNNEYIILWNKEASSFEAAYAFLYSKIGKG